MRHSRQFTPIYPFPGASLLAGVLQKNLLPPCLQTKHAKHSPWQQGFPTPHTHTHAHIAVCITWIRAKIGLPPPAVCSALSVTSLSCLPFFLCVHFFHQQGTQPNYLGSVWAWRTCCTQLELHAPGGADKFRCAIHRGALQVEQIVLSAHREANQGGGDFNFDELPKLEQALNRQRSMEQPMGKHSLLKHLWRTKLKRHASVSDLTKGWRLFSISRLTTSVTLLQVSRERTSLCASNA